MNAGFGLWALGFGLPSGPKSKIQNRISKTALAFLVVGCAAPAKHPSPAPVPSSPPPPATAAELRPDASPGERAILRLGGGSHPTEFEVEIARSQIGSQVALSLRSGGETLEREVYETSPQAFRVVDAGDNAFVPGLDLVRFPVRAGEGWDWTGKVVYAGASRPARARVDLAQDDGDWRSDVRLFVTADRGRPELERHLAFWFREGRGVARRSFGDVSSRRPRGEAWRP